MSMLNRTSSMIIALVLCEAAPALAQTAPSTPEHVPLQKTIGQPGPHSQLRRKQRKSGRNC